MKKQNNEKSVIRQRRIHSEELIKARVKDLVEKRITIRELMGLYNVSRTTVYNWLYKYSPQDTTFVVQMESEATKTKHLMQRVAELERIIGQKQMEIDFLNKLIEIGNEELEFDIKKNFSAKLSNGTGNGKENTIIQ